MIADWLERISPTVRIAGSGTWKKGHVEAARRLYDHEFVYFEDGACEVEYAEKIINFSRCGWMIVEPGILHKSIALTENVRRCWVHFDWIWHKPDGEIPVCTYAPAIPDKKRVRKAPSFVPRGPLSGKLQEDSICRQLLDEIIVTDSARARALFLQILIDVLGTEKNAQPPGIINGNQAFRLKALLDAMPAQDKSIRELSTSLGMSYEHLERVFKSSFGVSPLAYLNRLRIERAKSLLTSGRYTISDAASAAGFNDAAYFSRAFRKYAGLAPSEFMKKSSNK